MERINKIHAKDTTGVQKSCGVNTEKIIKNTNQTV